MPTVNEIYYSGLEKLFDTYCGSYRKDPAGYIKSVGGLRAVKTIILDFYKKYISEGVTKIEDLPRDEKEAFIKEVGDPDLDLDLYRAAYAMRHRNKKIDAEKGV